MKAAKGTVSVLVRNQERDGVGTIKLRWRHQGKRYYLSLGQSEKGPGILVVNYYPEPDPDEPKLDPELELGIQSETRFLKPSQIP